ncbi:hypothetical protein [Adoxophyes orana nucleopolyhedrovirus]|uniref:hypothetical protein n=1 Tax=Adoxophyes orana nucleopolyhedrovirus TaxID=542343 RepID=UPI0001829C03|nr:hypothetical protein [Adoxophyes orana nucleopolyhedrovirus]ACF05343.1 hypothetical protein [Adoxophyes orana nucleopolyhedrovirus]
MDKVRQQLNKFKNCLDNYSIASIRKARDNIDKKVVRDRCYHKLHEIDKKYFVCQSVNTFIDLCGGPGQFAKYIFDSNFECRGYGVTLNNALNYQFKNRNFTRIYGHDNSGNIFDTSVQFELQMLCENNAVDLIVADGAVDVSGNENHQETINFLIISEECKIILKLLKVNGNCVIKVFDTFNDETVCLLENFATHFENSYIFKPSSSRAANSERYLVCKNRLEVADKSKKINLNQIHFAKKQILALKKLLKHLNNGQLNASRSAAARSNKFKRLQ